MYKYHTKDYIERTNSYIGGFIKYLCIKFEEATKGEWSIYDDIIIETPIMFEELLKTVKESGIKNEIDIYHETYNQTNFYGFEVHRKNIA